MIKDPPQKKGVPKSKNPKIIAKIYLINLNTVKSPYLFDYTGHHFALKFKLNFCFKFTVLSASKGPTSIAYAFMRP